MTRLLIYVVIFFWIFANQFTFIIINVNTVSITNNTVEIIKIMDQDIKNFTNIQTTFETLKELKFYVKNVNISYKYSKKIDYDYLTNIADDFLMFITASTVNMDFKLSNYYLIKIKVDKETKNAEIKKANLRIKVHGDDPINS